MLEGFQYQDITAGKRAGIDGERNSMWKQHGESGLRLDQSGSHGELANLVSRGLEQFSETWPDRV